MKVVTYSRFSTDRQNESSIADQVRVCTEHAQRQGWEVVGGYEDQGISGAALGNRPGVLRLQEAAFARRFYALLVTDLSRLSRSQGDLSKMIDRLVAKGIRVVGVHDGYDSARRGHKLQAGLSGIIGEAIREMVKDCTYAALESRARAGRSAGGKAYGYRDGNVQPAEAAVVKEIFERFADGASCKTIAAELNRRGVPSPGSSWKRTERRASGWNGFRRSRHSAQRALPRRRALECERVAKGSRYRQALAAHAAALRVDHPRRRVAADSLGSSVAAIAAAHEPGQG
jgi:site-specific DNA recombinase